MVNDLDNESIEFMCLEKILARSKKYIFALMYFVKKIN